MEVSRFVTLVGLNPNFIIFAFPKKKIHEKNTLPGDIIQGNIVKT